MVEGSSRGAVGVRPPSLGSVQVFRMSDLHSKVEALLEGVGIGWMPLHLAHERLARGRLVEIPLGRATRQVFVPHLVHRRSEAAGRAARMLIELLREQLPPPRRGDRAAARGRRPPDPTSVGVDS